MKLLSFFAGVLLFLANGWTAHAQISRAFPDGVLLPNSQSKPVALAAANDTAVLIPTLVYIEDNLGGRADQLILCGFGAATDEAQRRFADELGVTVEPLRSPLGTPGENNAGLLGYLRSIARNN